MYQVLAFILLPIFLIKNILKLICTLIYELILLSKEVILGLLDYNFKHWKNIFKWK